MILPPEMLDAAESWSDECSGYDEAAALIRSFGSRETHDTAHHQSVWFCCLLYIRVLPTDIVMPTTNLTLGTIISDVQHWMLSGNRPDYTIRLCNPDLPFMERTGDPCDADYVETIPPLIRFALHGGVPDGVEVLDNAQIHDVYYHYVNPKAVSIGQWATSVALPASLAMRQLRPDEVR
jgi:hypothetical protein